MFKKIIFLMLLTAMSCQSRYGDKKYRLYDGVVRVHCWNNTQLDCPAQEEVEFFFEEEETIWENECGIRNFKDSLKNIHGSLDIHFTDELEETTSALGRYWPRQHFIEVQYPHEKWLDILRHELGLAIGQTQLGYVGEQAKIEWYQCHPLL